MKMFTIQKTMSGYQPKTGNARVGVSSYAIEQLGDIVHY